MLTVSKIDALGEIFEHKEWPIVHGKVLSRFNKYIRMLESMSDQEQDMMLELTRKFLHIEQEGYFPILLGVVKKIVDRNPTIKEYYILPALSEQDKLKGRLDKSSISLAYLFKGDRLKEDLDAGEIHFQVVKNIDNLSKSNMKGKILIVDDFIGSGETILESFKLYNIINNEGGFSFKDVIVLSLVAHEQGIDHLFEIGMSEIYYDKKINKGISDNFTGEKKDEYITLMTQIEDKIPGLKEKFKFGYGHCEALLHMHRIPNNTFPIYWHWRNVSPYNR